MAAFLVPPPVLFHRQLAGTSPQLWPRICRTVFATSNQFAMKNNGLSDCQCLHSNPSPPSSQLSGRTNPISPREVSMKSSPNSIQPLSAPNSSSDPPDMWFVEYLTPNDAYHHGVRELLYSARSAYQSVTVADTGAYGRALFLDGKIQTAEGDEPFYHEPLVHVPCVAHGRPQRVLVLGGGDGGVARELLRWKCIASVVVVDIDEVVVKACREFLPAIARGAFEDPRCELIIGDALNYVAETKERYDVIICDLTDPMEDSPSLGLFTAEFFRVLAERLAPGGTLSIQVGPASLVESPRLMPRVCKTLAAVFENVFPYQVFVPTYGSPLGMAVASDSLKSMPHEGEIDDLIRMNVKGSLTVLDGRAFRGLFALPRCTAKAIDEENEIFTKSNTANAFGKGIL